MADWNEHNHLHEDEYFVESLLAFWAVLGLVVGFGFVVGNGLGSEVGYTDAVVGLRIPHLLYLLLRILKQDFQLISGRMLGIYHVFLFLFQVYKYNYCL